MPRSRCSAAAWMRFYQESDVGLRLSHCSITLSDLVVSKSFASKSGTRYPARDTIRRFASYPMGKALCDDVCQCSMQAGKPGLEHAVVLRGVVVHWIQ